MHGSLCRSMVKHASDVRVVSTRYQQNEVWLEGQKCKGTLALGDHLS